jgi:glutamate-1-semialdehyde 2,1-aminomutase
MATLSAVLAGREEIYPKLEKTTAAMADGVARIAAEMGIGLTTNRVGSMFTWFFTPGHVKDFATAAASDTAAFARFHRGMLERGVWLPPSQYEAAFVSTAHGDAELEMVLKAARGALHDVLK